MEWIEEQASPTAECPRCASVHVFVRNGRFACQDCGHNFGKWSRLSDKRPEPTVIEVTELAEMGYGDKITL